MNDSGNSRILSLHNIHLSEAGEYKCSASLHNSSITAGIPVVLQCKHYWSTPEQKKFVVQSLAKSTKIYIYINLSFSHVCDFSLQFLNLQLSSEEMIVTQCMLELSLY